MTLPIEIKIKRLRQSIGDMIYQQQVCQSDPNEIMIDNLESKIKLAREEVQRLENEVKLKSDHTMN